jgi:phosphatidylethanolamine-binding protein (PEBP) family uncharacterized protein
MYSVIFLPLWFACMLTACDKGEEEVPGQETSFKVSSPVVGADSMLPTRYTCDGLSLSPPLSWQGQPVATQYFAVIMHHVASPEDVHWYLVLYNIPSGVTGLPENVSGVGTFGTNSVNGQTRYAPPCSQGPGRKDYIITVYALSEQAVPAVPADQVDRDALLEAIENITLASTSMTVWYSREVAE